MQTWSSHRSVPAPCSIRALGSFPWPRRSPKLIFTGVGFYSSGLNCLLLNRVESNCLKINFGSELAPKKLTSNSLLTEPRWYFPLERAEPQTSFPQGGTWCRACCVLPCKEPSSASPQHSELTSGVITCCPNAVTPTANNNKAPLSMPESAADVLQAELPTHRRECRFLSTQKDAEKPRGGGSGGTALLKGQRWPASRVRRALRRLVRDFRQEYCSHPCCFGVWEAVGRDRDPSGALQVGLPGL